MQLSDVTGALSTGVWLEITVHTRSTVCSLSRMAAERSASWRTRYALLIPSWLNSHALIRGLVVWYDQLRALRLRFAAGRRISGKPCAMCIFLVLAGDHSI